MKKKLIILLTILLLTPITICMGIFIYDWIQAEIAYFHWLNQNLLRMDFTPYEHRHNVREALLQRFPVGTSEEELKAFFLANRTQLPHTNGNWQPDDISCAICAPSYSIEPVSGYGVVLQVYSTDRGHIFNRALGGYWVIFFELDRETSTLKDIQVGGYGFNGGL